jgi:hypothetical protein
MRRSASSVGWCDTLTGAAPGACSGSDSEPPADPATASSEQDGKPVELGQKGAKA